MEVFDEKVDLEKPSPLSQEAPGNSVENEIDDLQSQSQADPEPEPVTKPPAAAIPQAHQSIPVENDPINLKSDIQTETSDQPVQNQ